MRRLFITGDTHGDFDFLSSWCEINNTTYEDILLILGDAGINYYGPTQPREVALKDKIAKCPITLLCVRGNHEDRPEDRPELGLGDVGIGDEVYLDIRYPNIWYTQDGGEYEIIGKKILTIGGAYSVDKFYRISRGWKWVANEMLNSDERAMILDKVYDKSYDLVCTHTCPIDWEPVDLFLSGIDQNSVPKDMERFLADVKRYITYKKWYFGHYHADREQWDNSHLLFHDIIEIH